MNNRETKGREIAAHAKLKRNSKLWIVPSQSGNGSYTVDLQAKEPCCTCPDYKKHHIECKHIFAAEYAAKSQGLKASDDKNSIRKRKTYRQVWTTYNLAQTREKAHFQELLYELCQNVEEPIQTMGRPRLLFSDILFCSVLKVYSGFATRRLITDLREAARRGYIMKAPHFNSIYNYFEMESLTAYLRDLIEQSSIPLKEVEENFAIDASGFRTAGYVRWFNARYGKEQDNHDWIKLHLTCGVNTHIVTAVEASKRHAHDSPFFKPLLNATARNFTISEVSADKAYSSQGNLKLVERHGGRPYIAFKDNARGDGKCKVWNRIYHYYCLHQEEYMEHYHKRSNVESTFSMIKRKFGESLRSKSKTGQINEALCKILCHNLCVLIQSMYELGIELTFCDNSLSSQKAP